MLTRILAALALLTRIPVRRPFSTKELAQATPFLPVIGALVGVAQVFVLRLLAPFLPPLLLSVSLLAVAACLTGALHLDGLADTADGFGGGHSREETLRIMRDPAIGTYGAVAVMLMLMARASALSTLIERRAAGPFLLLAPALSRWTMVALGHALSYARPEDGLGSLAGTVTRRQLALATAITAAVSVAARGQYAIAAWGAAIGVTVICGRIFARRLGGFTGDTLGANSELTEAAVLVTGVVLTR